MELVLLGNVPFSCELLMEGTASQKPQHCAKALNPQCIWVCVSVKLCPKSDKERCRDILASTRGGNPEKAHSNSSEKVQNIHKIFHKCLQASVVSVTRLQGSYSVANQEQETFENTSYKITVTLTWQ